ncbi:unnamed protein product [Acanthoscelides obtectus]|uniref:Uncharacterized protein n=1 Tax=Acanthoscelides obtectus TaxID=200917 RepID=A0A9P0MHM9_ACAOB|nr:unnamed protein product [Acanthoscelides obtectus]CAK1641734.1 hypothetical protein AOBTE_LOCUS12596 [Acanthoscelides obtectus]
MAALKMELTDSLTVQPIITDCGNDFDDVLSELSSSSPLICCTPPTDPSEDECIIPNRVVNEDWSIDENESFDDHSPLHSTDTTDDPDYSPSKEFLALEESSGFDNLSDEKELQSFERPQNENEENVESTSHEVSTSTSSTRIRDLQMKKNSVYCYFCESYVIHFPRHLFRNHASEMEVQRVQALPPRSKDRYNLLLDLRNKGNYLNSNEFAKPVRQGKLDSNYLPCTYCFGFYSTRNLWRHRKYCAGNPSKGKSQ